MYGLEDVDPRDSTELQMQFYRKPTADNTFDERNPMGYPTMPVPFEEGKFSEVMYMRKMTIHIHVDKKNGNDFAEFLVYLNQHKFDYALRPPEDREIGDTRPLGLFSIYIDLFKTNYGKLTKSPRDFLRNFKHLFAYVSLQASACYDNQITGNIGRFRLYPEPKDSDEIYHDVEKTIPLYQYLFEAMPNLYNRRKLEVI